MKGKRSPEVSRTSLPVASLKTTRKSRRQPEWKLFLLVSLIVTLPVLGTIAIVNISTRPSLALRTFARSCEGADAISVDWPKLARLTETEGDRTITAREILGSAVCLPGYMIQFDDPVDQYGRLGAFLLVPSPGNWLHPPHLDDGDVVVVKISGGGRTPFLERKVVCAQGRLSFVPVKTERVQAKFQLDASSVRELKDFP